jgi:hypothetical protein
MVEYVVSARDMGGGGYRNSLRTGVALVDEVTTRLTGKALSNQKPIFDLGGAGWWGASTLALAVTWPLLGVAVSIVPEAGWGNLVLVPAIIAGKAILVGRLRAQQVVFGHHAVHGTISRRWPRLNAAVKRFATVIPLAQNPNDYRSDHVTKHHKRKVFTTIDDPDAEFLSELGFRPGMKKAQAYRRLWETIASPRFHYLFAKARIRSAFVSSDRTHKLLASLWVGVLITVASLVPWWVFLLTVFMPMVPLYHVSALLQFLTEHRWLVTRDGPKTQSDYEARCVGRFSLLPPPSDDVQGTSRLMAWLGWGVRMVPELIVRTAVWVGDLPAHDHHHVVGHVGHDAHDWHEALFERQRSIDEGDRCGLAEREVYGLKAALDWVFEGLETAES